MVDRQSRFNRLGIFGRCHAGRFLEVAREIMDAAICKQFRNFGKIIYFLADIDLCLIYFQLVHIFDNAGARRFFEQDVDLRAADAELGAKLLQRPFSTQVSC